MSDTRYLLFGASGLMGQGFSRHIPGFDANAEILRFGRGTDPFRVGQDTAGLAFLERSPRATVAIWCQGPTDPSVSLETHRRFSVELPRAYFRWLAEHVELRLAVSLGSVHENEPRLCEKNSYLKAKREWLEATPSLGVRAAHFQLHTVYGQPVRPSSFVGQMLAAIREDRVFSMTSGTQLREYHHIDDLAPAILRMCRQRSIPPVLPLNHGHAVTLRALAEGVFAKVGKESLLSIGTHEARAQETFEQTWRATPAPFDVPYRDPVKGVADLLAD